jgi:hypothetical protein
MSPFVNAVRDDLIPLHAALVSLSDDLIVVLAFEENGTVDVDPDELLLDTLRELFGYDCLAYARIKEAAEAHGIDLGVEDETLEEAERSEE